MPAGFGFWNDEKVFCMGTFLDAVLASGKLPLMVVSIVRDNRRICRLIGLWLCLILSFDFQMFTK